MHELAVAQSLMKTILTQAEKHHAAKINSIHLKIGEMAGIMIEALEMGFTIASQDTIAEDAKLNIEEIPLKVKCKKCGAESAISGYVFRCAECLSPDIEVFSGRELLIDSIEIDE